MQPWEADLFMKGAGCPCCEGEPEVLFQPESLSDIEYGDLDPVIRLMQLEDRDAGKLPKWEEPAPPPPVLGRVWTGCMEHPIMRDYCMFIDVDEKEIREDSDAYYPYHRLEHKEYSWKENTRVIVSPRLTYNTCSYAESNLVEQSNYHAFLEEFGDRDDVFEICDSGSGYAIGILASCDSEEIEQALYAMEEYAIYCDDHYHNLVHEKEEDTWDEWGRGEFVRELEEFHNIDELILETDEEDKLFHNALDMSGEGWENTRGDEMIIDMNAVASMVDMQVISGEDGLVNIRLSAGDCHVDVEDVELTE